MPQGTICQLHYMGGGIVQFQEASGSWVRLPFHHARSLCVGQQVRFTLNAAGEAIGIQALQSGTEEVPGLSQKPAQQRKSEYEEGQIVPAKRRAEEAEALGLPRPAWKLQRCIDRFQNASDEERVEMLNRAEVKLREVLQQTVLDGDAICRLVREVVGWLQAPRFSKQMTRTCGGSWEAGGTGDLQSRIRRLLISALSSLDLTDGTTKQAVETAVAYIQQLMQDVCLTDLETSRAAREWRKLQSLISMEGGSTLSIEDVSNKKLLRSETLRKEDKARTFEGAFTPNVRVRQLPSVSAGDAVRLTCPSCPRSITSRWWWRHPKTQVVFLVIPTQGCYHGGTQRSRGTVDETSRWRPVDAWPTQADSFSTLDFCHHRRQRSLCKECGGYSICSHGKRRYRCRLCRKPAGKSGFLRPIGWLFPCCVPLLVG